MNQKAGAQAPTFRLLNRQTFLIVGCMASQEAMINLQVDDLDGVLDRLAGEGATVDPKRESYDFGRFGVKSCIENALVYPRSREVEFPIPEGSWHPFLRQANRAIRASCGTSMQA